MSNCAHTILSNIEKNRLVLGLKNDSFKRTCLACYTKWNGGPLNCKKEECIGRAMCVDYDSFIPEKTLIYFYKSKIRLLKQFFNIYYRFYWRKKAIVYYKVTKLHNCFANLMSKEEDSSV